MARIPDDPGSPEQGVGGEPLSTLQLARLVVIRGRRGTGRRSMARDIHGRSSRQRRMFRAYDCGGCSPLEARRRFLGEFQIASRPIRTFAGGASGSTVERAPQRPDRYIKYLGLLEEVGGGTLYLEQVEKLTLDMQRILARALEDREFVPIGGTHSIPFDGRIIVSTTRDPGELITAGLLHEGFFKLAGDRVLCSETPAASD